jgi:N-acetylglucosamine kinase-like BadF-type ATPase
VATPSSSSPLGVYAVPEPAFTPTQTERPPTAHRLAPTEAHGVVVGIDAGSTRTRARAVRNGDVVHEGTGGPGNPLSAEKHTLGASYETALAGCPPAAQVCACVAGTEGPDQRDQIADLLARHFQDAQISVVPDYVGAFHAAPEGTDVSVIAGTGTVICSRSPDGGYAVSGGLGWILSDHGSAARLGQAALEHVVNGPTPVRSPVITALVKTFGSSDPRTVARAVNSSHDPAHLLAGAAPLLTSAAEQGAAWAIRWLNTEMAELAATATHHIRQNVNQPGIVRMALSGGVWESPACVSSFADAITRLARRPVEVARTPSDPIEGAIRLAQKTMTRPV